VISGAILSSCRLGFAHLCAKMGLIDDCCRFLYEYVFLDRANNDVAGYVAGFTAYEYSIQCMYVKCYVIHILNWFLVINITEVRAICLWTFNTYCATTIQSTNLWP
jgi:hypothetical protein